MTHTEREKEFHSKITDEFRQMLIEAYRIFGWGGDCVEAKDFICNVLDLSPIDVPEMYELGDE